jgi:hypothetical protein
MSLPPKAAASPALTARIIHASLVIGVLLFFAVAWFLGSRTSPPPSAPSARALYLVLILGAAGLFAGAVFAARRIAAPSAGTPQDDWWQVNLGRAIVVWALVEAPSLLGLVVYLLTRDSRALIPTLAGLLLFANYRPSRLFDR